VIEKEVKGIVNKHCVGFFVVAFVMFFFSIAVEAAQNNPPIQKDKSWRRGETRATLDPNLFKDGRVKKAYQVAKDIPWVLDSIYCYCHCDVFFKHKSLLSCYVDDHAAM
jgi:hypothetical protein